MSTPKTPEERAKAYLKERFPAYLKDTSVMHIDEEVWLAGWHARDEEVANWKAGVSDLQDRLFAELKLSVRAMKERDQLRAEVERLSTGFRLPVKPSYWVHEGECPPECSCYDAKSRAWLAEKFISPQAPDGEGSGK